MRLVFMGTPDFAAVSLRALIRAGRNVAGVVTRPDRPRRNRSSSPEPSPVKTVALERDLPVLQPESLTGPDFEEAISSMAPECVVVVAYGRILPQQILKIPSRWCINLHASLLPRYRGAAPIARAIMDGERVTGVTTMKMDQGLDTGDILLQRECPIGIAETTGDLTAKLAEEGAGLLLETLDLHERGAIDPRRQDPRAATMAPPLSRKEGIVDWTRGAVEVANHVRGCNPWPLAFTYLRGRPFKIVRSEVSFEPRKGRGRVSAGEVSHIDDRRIIVQCCKDSRLALIEVRFPGGRTITARDALNGRLIRVGDVLASAPED